MKSADHTVPTPIGDERNSINRSEVMSRSINQLALQVDTCNFRGTCGESAVATKQNFLPAFQNTQTGEWALSKLKNGNPAPMHLLSYLPIDWAQSVDADGPGNRTEARHYRRICSREPFLYARRSGGKSNRIKSCRQTYALRPSI